MKQLFVGDPSGPNDVAWAIKAIQEIIRASFGEDEVITNYDDIEGLPTLGTIASQDASAVAITGGTIGGTTVTVGTPGSSAAATPKSYVDTGDTNATGNAVSTAATAAAAAYLAKSANLSDLANAGTSRTNLDVEQLGTITAVLTKTSAYTFILTDRGKTVEYNSASGGTFTIPANASVAFVVGTYINLVQVGAGQLTVAPDTGVTMRSYNGNTKLVGQWAMATLYKRGTNEWVLGGATTP